MSKETAASDAARRAIAYLRTPRAIRERCEELFAHAEKDRLEHFRLDMGRLPHVVDLVTRETLANYPDLEVPFHSRWRHFDVGGLNREALLDRELAELDPAERARTKLELAIVSVLVDAGAGAEWRYADPSTGRTFTRSEGLAVASFEAFRSGLFGEKPYTATAGGLERLTPESLAEAFQVRDANSLIGVEGRTELLRALGRTVSKNRDIFGAEARLGGFYDHLTRSGDLRTLTATDLLTFVLEVLGPIWPGRIELGGVNLGDVWRHPKVGGTDATTGLVPFHKLSQWLTYSLAEPFMESGVAITGVEQLTGLAEYRNGGLFLDIGVLALRDPSQGDRGHAPADEIIVEWRALTVALLDRVGAEVRARRGKSPEELPLAKILQGGTWNVGRALAKELRPGGVPPLTVVSDGTVF